MVRAKDIAYVTYRVPDLDRAEKFLLDFGLHVAFRDDATLYMRCAGPMPFVYVAEQGTADRAPGFQSVAVTVDDEAELDELARHPDASDVEDLATPGGGRRVRLTHSDGYLIDVVHGIAQAESKEIRDPLVLNFATQKNRLNTPQRLTKNPPEILRAGHCAMNVSDALASMAWFGETIGMRPSDFICIPGQPDAVVGAFLSFDCGDAFRDHHAIAVFQAATPDRVAIHHCAFEVQDCDAVHVGHDYLARQGYQSDVGVGRHLAGSQVFDYWRDPFGNRIEHYADGDVINKDYEPSVIEGTPEGVTQWGPVPPQDFFE